MKTLIVRIGATLTIRAIARAADSGGRDPCETLAFLQEHKIRWSDELTKLSAVLSETAENGPLHGETKKFKKLKGSELYEFKSPHGLRILCFWDEGGVIVCTHGYVKDSQKAPKREIDKGERLRREYFEAKKNRELTHVQLPSKRTA
jgi:phage-related protein